MGIISDIYHYPKIIVLRRVAADNSSLKNWQESLHYWALPVRNITFKVTDPDLLQKSGGVIRGMSGSPILQDGKLVGAVTHVLVNQPDTGYGIFIENMLDAAR